MKNQKVVPIQSDVTNSLDSLSVEFSNIVTLLDLIELHEAVKSDSTLFGGTSMVRAGVMRIWNRLDDVADSNRAV